MKKYWKDIKWLLNYMANVFMYSIIVILILIGIILLMYFIDVKKRQNTTEWVAPLYGAYVIMSGSMEPTIMAGDAIVNKRVDGELEVGDIVTYRSEDPHFYGIMITHRIIDIKQENGELVYVTKGDDNSTPDRLSVKRNQIYGKVVMVIPKIGYLQMFLATSYGWIIAVVIPCVGVIAYDVVKLIKNIKKNNRHLKRKERD